jgi:hypothetical protein
MQPPCARVLCGARPLSARSCGDGNELRTQALRAAKSVCLNIAEGARVYGRARGARRSDRRGRKRARVRRRARGNVARVLATGGKLYAVHWKLIRWDGPPAVGAGFDSRRPSQ